MQLQKSTLALVAAAATMAVNSAQASLIFQMDFNDAAGNQSLADRGTTGVTGAFAGGAGYSSTVAPSNSGGFSGSFDGINGSSVDFGDIDALDGLTDLTITAWVRSSTANSGSASSSSRIVWDRTGSTGFDLYYHDTDSELELVLDGTVVNGGGSFPGQQWTWIAVTYDSSESEATFYTGNGTTLSAGDTVAIDKGALGSNDSSFFIGNRSDGLRPYQGLIDNVRVYSSVEDAASLTTIMTFDDVPEPNSLALLSLGGLLVASRRRRGSANAEQSA